MKNLLPAAERIVQTCMSWRMAVMVHRSSTRIRFGKSFRSSSISIWKRKESFEITLWNEKERKRAYCPHLRIFAASFALARSWKSCSLEWWWHMEKMTGTVESVSKRIIKCGWNLLYHSVPGSQRRSSLLFPLAVFPLAFHYQGFLMLLQSTDYRQHGGYRSNDLICPYSLRWDSSSYGSLHLPSLDFIYNNNFALRKRSDFVIIHKKESGASWWIQEICRFS